MKDIKDRFSQQSDIYKEFRPVYPPQMYTYMLSLCSNKDCAWDCGTGNAQVASVLAQHFTKVEATDISENQLQQAPTLQNVNYSLQRAESTNFPTNNFDLITVAQALHWFDFLPFYAEVKRVLKPGGVLAVWGYSLLQIEEKIDVLIQDFYKNTIGSYWDIERKHIDAAYETIPFPMEEVIVNNGFYIEEKWSRVQLEGYLNSWSSVQNYKLQHDGQNPVDKLMLEIEKVWQTDESKLVKFPIFLKTGVFNV